MITRRSLLAGGAGLSAAHAARRPALTPKEFRSQLRGPILSFPTVFKADGALDCDSIRGMIDRAIQAGVRVIALTRGNSQYDWLSYREIEELTRCTIEAAKGRALTIAATSGWWTSRALEYARFAAQAGADAIQVFVPGGGSDASLTGHFRAIANATRLPLVIHGQPSPALLRSLVGIEEVSALKDEFNLEYTVPLMTEFGERLAWFAGGTKSRFLAYRPYGMKAYYTTLVTFAPQVAMAFWAAVQKNDLEAAAGIVSRYDVPFFNRWSFAFWLGTLEHFGIARLTLRSPREALNSEQMRDLAAFYDGLGLKKP